MSVLKENPEVEKFIQLLGKMEVVEFAGIAQILKVKVVEDDKPRKFEDVFNEIIDNFLKLNRRQRRNLFKIMKAAK